MSDSQALPNPLKLVGRASRGFVRVADGELRSLGFATSQFPVLGALRDGQALSQAELARLAQVEQPSMAQLLNRMERDGLVERLPDPEDKRSRLISLTAIAVGRLSKAKTLMDACTTNALTGFTPQEVDQLVSLLNRLNENIDRMAEGGLS